MASALAAPGGPQSTAQSAGLLKLPLPRMSPPPIQLSLGRFRAGAWLRGGHLASRKGTRFQTPRPHHPPDAYLGQATRFLQAQLPIKVTIKQTFL